MNTFFLDIYIVPRDSDSNWYPIPYQRALIYIIEFCPFGTLLILGTDGPDCQCMFLFKTDLLPSNVSYISAKRLGYSDNK